MMMMVVVVMMTKTYRCHGFIGPSAESSASSVHDSCRAHARKQDQARGPDPRQCHAHFGHPVAVVLTMHNGVDHLEVAFNGDDLYLPFTFSASTSHLTPSSVWT